MTDKVKESPKHGNAEGTTVDQHPVQHGQPTTQKTPSVSQADGTAAEAPTGETQSKAQPSGYSGENPATAGPGSTKVTSQTPENRDGEIHPSTQSSEKDNMPANPTRDSAGEVGEPTGKGNLEISKETFEGGNQANEKRLDKEKDGNIVEGEEKEENAA